MVTIDVIMHKLHVMIVSLPGTWQRILQQNLEDYPFIEVDNVVNGALSAVQLIERQSPDMVLIDSSIPIQDVIALIKNVNERNPDIQVIVLADTTYQLKRMLRSGAEYAISSCNYEEEISEVIREIYVQQIKNAEKSNKSIKADH